MRPVTCLMPVPTVYVALQAVSAGPPTMSSSCKKGSKHAMITPCKSIPQKWSLHKCCNNTMCPGVAFGVDRSTKAAKFELGRLDTHETDAWLASSIFWGYIPILGLTEPTLLQKQHIL